MGKTHTTMKKVIFLLLSLLVVSQTFAGGGGSGSGGATTGPSGPPPTCVGNSPAGNTCAQATPICDFDGYCGSTASTYGANYWSQLNSTFCGSIENNSFISFVASSSSISFNVWVTSSQNGDGIQIMVFSSAGNCSGAVTSYLCWNPGNVPSGSTTLTATGLTPGNQYYIMIDGQAGDVANYVIGANSGISTPLVVSPQTATICSGETVTLNASGANGSYTWNASPDLNVTTGATVIASPPGPGTYSYTVNSTGGNTNCPSATSQTATITVNPCGCTVTASNSGNICPGGTVNLSASNYPSGTYSWTGPNGFTSNVQNPTSVVVPTTPGTYAYTVTLSAPSVTPCSATTTVTVNPLPVVTGGGPQTVCSGSQVTLSGSGASTYTWDNGVSNGVAFTPLATTTYTVTGVDANGCSNTNTVTVTVNPLPVVSAGNDQQICSGTSTILTGSGAVSYVWDNAVTNGVAFTPSASATYTVTGTDANGCTGTDLVDVTLNPLPSVSAGSDQSVCAGSSVVLTGSGASTYVWDNGVFNGVAFTPLATTTYTLTGTDVNGCVATDQVLVTVNPIPTINGGPDVTVCEGSTITLAATGGTTYTWDNGVINGVAFTPSVGTQTYTVVDNNPTGCVSSDQVIVTVNPNPIVNAGADQAVCQGATVSLSALGANSYVWNNGVVNGVPFVIQSTQTYTVTGTTAQGCIGTDQVTIQVTPTPQPSLTPSTTFGCIPLEVTFNNSSPDLGNSFVWDFGNGTSSNLVGPHTVTYTQEGCFTLTLTATTPDGCVGSQTYPSLICVASNPIAEFTAVPSILTIISPITTFENSSQNASQYIWDYGDGTGASNILSPQHTYPDVEGNYTIQLIAISDLGCRDTAWTTIEIQEALVFYVPNTFTPDGDQYNQQFKPIFTSGYDPFDYHLMIFNRWGEVVFESYDAEYGWPGNYGRGNGICQDGTYIWKIEFKTSYSDARKMYTGSVNLMR